EKGHAAGNELNGTTTALNLGLGRMVSSKKDCIGNVLSRRDGMNAPDALALVGLKPLDPKDTVLAGGHLMAMSGPVDAGHDQGYVTSAAYSPILESSIGLGFVKDGFARKGETLRLVNPVEGGEIKVEVVSAHFVDPEGEKLRA
ncbi:glycine cleavage T C-terminal barrel domain-containing protein, partial [Cognatishimia sp.]|uniref:glycine cleavage T C-terminal barrel domain-containing protein n=1 Tax=Cognatishimia sp. TaxID=2211648 RepID=UPI00351115E4